MWSDGFPMLAIGVGSPTVGPMTPSTPPPSESYAAPSAPPHPPRHFYGELSATYDIQFCGAMVYDEEDELVHRRGVEVLGL